MKQLCLLLFGLIAGNVSFAMNAEINLNNVADSLAPARTDTVIALNGVAVAENNIRKDSADPLSAVAQAPLPIGIAAPVASSNFVTRNLNNYVAGYISDYYKDNTRGLQTVQSKSEPYFTLIEKVFQKYGIPAELKYLAVIESGLNTNAVSRVGAVGTWQLMGSTARILGLTVSRHHDDRKDLYKSTNAAAKYLSQLYGMLNNWLLVVAAYNCGPGGVLKAIKESGSNNYWDLQKFLPKESQSHVMKFLATAYILDRFSDFFGLDNDIPNASDIAASRSDNTFVNNADIQSMTITGKYCMPVIAKFISMDINELNRLNPGFDKMLASADNTYQLKLPSQKMEIFKANKNAILNESVQLLMENNRVFNASNYPAPVPLAKNSASAVSHHHSSSNKATKRHTN